MGLTSASTGRRTLVAHQKSKKSTNENVVIALAGNPNVGKSTVFNALTGMHQHTGNWPGKTVGSARGSYTYKDKTYILVDIPGAYSLSAHSAEEEIARDFICFGRADAVVLVCDATCLVRNMNLVLQTLEITDKALVCVNLMDEAKHKNIQIDCNALSKALGVPVVGITARKKKDLALLRESIHRLHASRPTQVTYRPEIEEAITQIAPSIKAATNALPARWLALKLLDPDPSLLASLQNFLGFALEEQPSVKSAVADAKERLAEKWPETETMRDVLVTDLYKTAESVCQKAVCHKNKQYLEKQLTVDRLLTGKITGVPVMVLMLLCILWITITGANYPSAWLSKFLFGLETPLSNACLTIGMPDFLRNALVFGVYRVLAWVISVMLPPMAIFFPLFTLLEDLGYLPRVAFNLDHCFKKCHACGKQALSMCMGLGCNAAGVIGCRIIDSPRERLIAILTNSFMPCNGRFPTLISIITMFFVAGSAGFLTSLSSAVLLTFVLVLGVFITLLCSRLLSATFLKGMPSSFTLELPPYRKPQIGKVLVRSVFDRTLFVLGRAISVAAPAGLIIYLMANVTVAGQTLLTHCAAFLDPFARLLGLDGVILMAFILGFPANEIVMPIAIMAYMSSGTITEFESLSALRALLVDNGWTALTAACTMLFSLLHWPCSTTLISIKKETGSWRWTLLGFLLPTVAGMLLCFLLTTAVRTFT